VRIVLGPILGRIDETSINILIEVDIECEISLVPVIIDQDDSHGFLKKSDLNSSSFSTYQLLPHTPKICHLSNLLPNTHYHVYLGGVRREDCLGGRCEFSTFDPLVHNSSHQSSMEEKEEEKEQGGDEGFVTEKDFHLFMVR